MNFRSRLILVAAAAVAIAIALASTVGYLTVRRQMLHQIDNRLRATAARVASGFDPDAFRTQTLPSSPFRNDTQFFQYVVSDGSRVHPRGTPGLPVNSVDKQIASGSVGGQLRNITVDGQHMRLITVQVSPALANEVGPLAVQVALSLRDVDRTLSSFRVDLIMIGLGGVVLAIALGSLVATAALRPVGRLTRAVEHVTETQDLSAKIEVRHADELGRLALSFNAMLDALDGARRQQTQLVADASHELRTPLTSLRTNIEVLQQQPDMPPAERERLLADVTEQLEEMGILVGDLVELAREDAPLHAELSEDIRIDELVRQAVERAQLHSPRLAFAVGQLEPAVVYGDRALLQRALANLLDNACKWSPPEGVIDVEAHDGDIVIRDHGPGIAAEDLPHVFDRFYRAPSARSMPGSGLGLAIVRRVAEVHGGTISAERPEGGGTQMRLHLPAVVLPTPVDVPESPIPT